MNLNVIIKNFAEQRFLPLLDPVINSPCENKKSRAIAGAAFVNWDQVLCGGCNWGIADMRIYHNFSEGSKTADLVGEITGFATPKIPVIPVAILNPV